MLYLSNSPSHLKWEIPDQFGPDSENFCLSLAPGSLLIANSHTPGFIYFLRATSTRLLCGGLLRKIRSLGMGGGSVFTKTSPSNGIGCSFRRVTFFFFLSFQIQTSKALGLFA